MSNFDCSTSEASYKDKQKFPLKEQQLGAAHLVELHNDVGKENNQTLSLTIGEF